MKIKIQNKIDESINTIVHSESINFYEVSFSNKKINFNFNFIDDDVAYNLEKFRNIKLPHFDKIQIDLNSIDLNKLDYIFEMVFKNFGKIYSLKSDYLYKEMSLIISKENISKLDEKAILDKFYKWESVETAKYLSDTEPGLDGTPENLSKEIIKIFKNSKVEIEFLNKQKLKENNLNLILAVNQNSKNEPNMMVAKYYGNPNSKENILLVGKGICFDSGGYSLKGSEGIRTMRLDKSGGCNVVGIMEFLSKSKPKINVIGIVPFTENSMGGVFPSTVIKTSIGKTVQIDNTDAEGRLVLADGISYGIKNYNPKSIIEMSTLTGAIASALGKYMTGCFSKNLKFANEFKEIVDKSGDEVWLMPIHRKNIEIIRTAELADISNAPLKANHGGSSQAAAFLNEFVDQSINFIHLDIGGTGVLDNRATGVMVKGLIDYLIQISNK